MLQLSEQYESIILNFTELAYVSSAGLRTMIKLQKEFWAKGGTLLVKKRAQRCYGYYSGDWLYQFSSV